ncbi:MAG: hypothetical protein ABIP94_24020 [Planctomycetota bacterium]
MTYCHFLLPCCLLSTALVLPSQTQLVLPDYQYLCESPTQLSNTGATTWWRGTGGRFQIIYEASHFTSKAGVSGPVTINKIMFRGEDGEPNVGGQSWAGVVVQLGSTSLNNTNMSTTFLANQVPVIPNTTTLGLPGVTAVTVLPSLGTTPNNYNIVIDLAALGASISYDPTSAEPNLLIDIMMPTAATIPVTSGAVMAFQDSIGTVAQVRGEGVTTATLPPLALTGTTSATPPVVGIELASGGGDPVLIPARNEYYGAACGGSPSTFYQTFLQGEVFDLSAGLTLTPDSPTAPTIYTVTSGAGAFDATQVNATPDSIADDFLTAAIPLGFTLNYPGGSTTAIKACTNGFVWLDTAMTSNDLSPSVAELLGTTLTFTARLAPFWFDLHAGRNTATHPNSGMHVKIDTSGGAGNAVAYVTWFNTGIFNQVSTLGSGGHVVIQMQCVLRELTGVVEFRYGSMLTAPSSANTACAIVGFSRGRIAGVGSVDPQSRDLSIEVPFSTKVEVAGVNNMGQTAVATPDAGGAHYSGRMFGGQTLTWNANNVPAGTPQMLGIQLLDIGSSRPGFQLLGITAPNCMVSTTLSPLLWEFFFTPLPASVVGTVPLTVPHGFQGTEIFAQFVVLDFTAGAPLVFRSSNALKHTIGLD